MICQPVKQGRRIDMKKYSMETIVGIFVVIGMFCVGYMTVKLGKISWFGNAYYTLYANFGTVSGLRVDSPVEMNGIVVGKVKRLSMNQEKQVATIALDILNGIKVYEDATAAVKTSGLIGDKFVKIDPGGGGELLKPGGTIIDTNSPLDVEDLIGKYVFGDVTKGSKKESK
jgi:phospholipid/cholesterol/gamma-HCH transport system substrate-binding protein